MFEISQKFIYKIYIIRNDNDAIWVHIAQKGVILFRFSQNSCGSSSWILLHGIVQNFVYNILTLKNDIDIIFANLAC